MNIVFISNEYPLWTSGGLGTFLQTFGRSLVANGHKATILGIGLEIKMELLYDVGVSIIRLPKNTSILPNFIYNALALNKKIKELQSENPIDIIESPEMGLAFISKKYSAKKVIRLHGGHHFFAEAEKRNVTWRKAFLEKRSFCKADGFIAVSNYVKTHTEKYLSYKNRPITTINYPLDTEAKDLNRPTNLNSILFAGTVCEKKGVRQLIEAFKIVRKHYPEKKLDIYGRDWYFPGGESYVAYLKKKYNASYFENVTFHGSIPRSILYEKYAEASFCIFPSHMETQGMVSLEAMLLKKPVIFSKFGPGPETIVHGKTGLLCNTYDPSDIAKKMIWFIENPEKAKDIGENASRAVKKKYDINMILQKNINFYHSLLK